MQHSSSSGTQKLRQFRGTVSFVLFFKYFISNQNEGIQTLKMYALLQ